MELSHKPFALSDLIGKPVCDGSGRRLGRVFETRGHWDREGSIVIDELIVGRRALLRRLRGPGPGAQTIPWEAVAEIADDRIVVSGS